MIPAILFSITYSHFSFTAFLLFAGFSFGQVSKMSSAEIQAEEDAINKLGDRVVKAGWSFF